VAKYDPLFEFLCRAGDGALEMSIDDISVLVRGLPASALTRRSWWGNDAAGPQNVQARAWLNAGREVDSVDLDRGIVRFSAAGWRRGA
jgi:hypothetical protein